MLKSPGTSYSYFPSVDGLRFSAFMLVFLLHARSIFYVPFFNRIGWTGVHLFFLLSGFLLTKLLLAEYSQNKSIKISKYFIRRILRIWPLYFLYLVLVIVVSQFSNEYPLSISRLLGNTFFYDNILTATTEEFNKNFASGHLWSISQEEQYYLLLPFLVPWLARQDRKKIVLLFSGLFVLLFIARFAIAFLNFRFTFSYVLPLSCDSLLAGILLGLGIIDNWARKINSILAFFIGAALLIVLYFLPYVTVSDNGLLLIANYFIPAVAFFFIFISVVYHEQSVAYRFFSIKIFRYLGKISFGLYMFHPLAKIITLRVLNFFNKPPDFSSFLLFLLLTIVLAVISYELFEKHFLKMKARFTIIKSRDV